MTAWVLSCWRSCRPSSHQLLWGKGPGGSGCSHLNCRFWSTSMGFPDACDCSGDPPKFMEFEALLAVVSNTGTGDILHALGSSGTFMVRIPPELSETQRRSGCETPLIQPAVPIIQPSIMVSRGRGCF